MLSAGMRPVDVEFFKTASGQLRYAGVWHDNVEGRQWESRRNMSESFFLDRVERLRRDDLIPIDIEVVPSGDELRYAAIWSENTGVLWHLGERAVMTNVPAQLGQGNEYLARIGNPVTVRAVPQHGCPGHQGVRIGYQCE